MKWGPEFAERHDLSSLRLLGSVGEPINPEAWLWYHEHTFRADGPHTVMDDRVYYTPPLGVLGRIAHALVIRQMLLGIFHYRQDVIRLRFG